MVLWDQAWYFGSVVLLWDQVQYFGSVMVLWISHGTLGSGTILWISHILGSGMVLWISHVTFGDQVWYSGIRHGTLDQLSYFGIRHYTLDQSWYFGIRHGTLDQALYFGIRHGTLYQSCRAANHYVLAVVCTTLLRSWSYHYAFPEKNKNCLFLIPCVRVGIRFTSNRLSVCLFVFEMLVVPQPIGVRILTSWPIVAFGSIPTFVSLPGKTTSIFSHFKSACRSEKLKASSQVMSLVHIHTQKMRTRISGKSIIQKSFCALYDQHRAPSMWSAAPASSVLGTFLSPLAERTTSNNASTQSVTSSKEKW